MLILIHHLVLIKIRYWLKCLWNLILPKVFSRIKLLILWVEEHLLVLRINILLIWLDIKVWVYASHCWISIDLVKIEILTLLRYVQLLRTLIHAHLLICELVVLKYLLLHLHILLHRLVVGSTESTSRCPDVVRACLAIRKLSNCWLLFLHALSFNFIR